MRRLLALVFLAVLGACGSSSSPCQSANQKMCDKACSCPSSDGKCHMKAMGFTLSFTRGTACFGAVLGCDSASSQQYDWAACTHGPRHRAVHDPDRHDGSGDRAARRLHHQAG